MDRSPTPAPTASTLSLPSPPSRLDPPKRRPRGRNKARYRPTKYLKGKKAKEVRAETFLIRRIQGYSPVQIADEFGCSQETVFLALRLARKQEIFEKARSFILQGLLPKALAVYDKSLTQALERDEVSAADTAVASQIVYGLGVLSNKIEVIPITSRSEAAETLEIWRERTLQRLRGGLPSGDGPIIDVQPLPAGDTGDHERVGQSTFFGDTPAAPAGTPAGGPDVGGAGMATGMADGRND